MDKESNTARQLAGMKGCFRFFSRSNYVAKICVHSYLIRSQSFVPGLERGVYRYFRLVPSTAEYRASLAR